jgi:hypothetical protein
MTLWINDDSNKATSITISGGRLVATQTGATRTAMVKADQGSYPGNSDDWYFEITVNVKNPTATPPADCIGVGIAQNLTNVNTGFNAYSVGYYADGWSIAYGAPSFTGIGYDVGDVIGVRKQSSGVPPPPVGERGGHFPDTINTVLARRTVVLDLLVRFDFLSGAMRLWQGFGTLHTNDGNNWEGIGRLGQISDLESAIGGTAPQAKFILSGVDPTILADALDQETEIYGRNCDVYMQFFNEDFTPLDNPYVIWSGLMDTLRITQTVDTCQVEMTAETLFARRSKPPLGVLSDREQQQFFPGDNALTGIPALMSKTSIWPVILPQS